MLNLHHFPHIATQLTYHAPLDLLNDMVDMICASVKTALFIEAVNKLYTIMVCFQPDYIVTKKEEKND